MSHSRYNIASSKQKQRDSANKTGFWRPGAEQPADSNPQADNYFVYNSKMHLPMMKQRMSLPIYKRKTEFLYAVETHFVTIVVGETGCGKTTQIPQYLDEAGWTAGNRMVAITQPRRIAAVKVAERVSEEMGSKLGVDVGYSIRFDRCFDPIKTRIKFLTDGTLLRELMEDPLLSCYSVVVLDEVHERSVSTDLLLGLLKKIMRKRRDLRLVISSATLDAVKIKSFFDRALMLGKDRREKNELDKAAVLYFEGRSFPVESFYLSNPVKSYIDAAIKTVMNLHQTEPAGDILVFLTGEEEVDHVCAMLKEEFLNLSSNKPHTGALIPLPLYSSLSPRLQLRCFQKAAPGSRKVIVSTNVAETSVTIPGVVYVVDCLFSKIRLYNNQNSIESLCSVPISKASAEQRKGRAGRMLPGKCFRLCTEKDFSSLVLEDIPEIQRVSMESSIMQLKALGVDKIVDFEFFSPPPVEIVAKGLQLLYGLKAIDEHTILTKEGTLMVEFPLDPRMTRSILVSAEQGCSEEVLSIAAMVSSGNIFIQPTKTASTFKNSRVDIARKKFAVREGDHITLLNIFNSFLGKQNSPHWCNGLYLNFKSLKRAVRIRKQLVNASKKLKLNITSACGEVEPILKSITAGFFDNAAKLQNDGSFKMVHNDEKLYLHPHSVLSKSAPGWVMFNNVVCSEENYMVNVSVLEPKWLLELKNGSFEMKVGV